MMYYMEEVVLSEGEILFLDNQIDDLSLYFIVKGSVDLFYECYRSQEYKGTVVKSIDTQEECFGEYGFFTGKIYIKYMYILIIILYMYRDVEAIFSPFYRLYHSI